MAFENDPEGRRIAISYAGADFDKPRTVTIEPLFSYIDEWSLAEFQEAFAEAVASIPAEYRDSAKVRLEDQGYDSGTKFSISYVGPESAQTVADRVRRCEEYVAETRRRERSEFERLKQKFGNG